MWIYYSWMGFHLLLGSALVGMLRDPNGAAMGFLNQVMFRHLQHT